MSDAQMYEHIRGHISKRYEYAVTYGGLTYPNIFNTVYAAKDWYKNHRDPEGCSVVRRMVTDWEVVSYD